MSRPDERQLALEWLGGATERRLRRSRPGFDDLDWDACAASALDPADPDLLEARRVWTNGVFTEYASSAAFSAMNLAFLECQAPVDLCAAAADFALDELVHVALVARLVMTLGGATPFLADMSRVAPARTRARPLLRAAELVVKVSCVGEALSLPALTASHKGATEPLTRAVLERLRHDEGPHAAIGHWFLEWAESRLTARDRAHLGQVAAEAVSVYAPLWNAPEAADRKVAGRDGETTYKAYMEEAVKERIVTPLERFGIFSASCRPTTRAPARRSARSTPT